MQNISVCVTSAYGPLDNANVLKKTAFWKYLSQQAQRAKISSKGFILQGELNAWLGPKEL